MVRRSIYALAEREKKIDEKERVNDREFSELSPNNSEKVENREKR